MIKNKLTELISKRVSIKGEINFTTNPITREIIELLSNNIDETISFFNYECTGEQFIYLSEVFDEIAEKTQSRSLIAALRKCAAKYPRETQEYNIIYFIDSAEDYIL